MHLVASALTLASAEMLLQKLRIAWLERSPRPCGTLPFLYLCLPLHFLLLPSAVVVVVSFVQLDKLKMKKVFYAVVLQAAPFSISFCQFYRSSLSLPLCSYSRSQTVATSSKPNGAGSTDEGDAAMARHIDFALPLVDSLSLSLCLPFPLSAGQ